MPGSDFDTLVTDYYRPLYRFAISLTGSEADAGDLTQQVFYSWATESHEFVDPAKPKLWLFAALHRAFLATRTTKNPPLNSEPAAFEVNPPDLTTATAQSLQSADVLTALGKLEETLRAPTALFYLEDCACDEIAGMLDLSVREVRSLVARGSTQINRIISSDAAADKPVEASATNTGDAKRILALFRPGTADEQDPYFTEARQLAQSDPVLQRWFVDQCAVQLALGGKLRDMPIPPGLKEQIIAEREIRRPFLQRYWGVLLAGAAAIIVLVSIQANPWFFGTVPNNHADYVRSMAEAALNTTNMTMESADQFKVRAFLGRHRAPSDFAFTSGLQRASLAGCSVSYWQGREVSMVGFKTGRRLRPNRRCDLWLFVAPRVAVAQSPPPGGVDFKKADSAITASWSDDTHTFLLTTLGDEDFLKQYIP